MSRIKNRFLPVLSRPPLPTSAITSAPDISWTRVGPGKDHVLSELERLYWDGVKAELENIVRTLKAWQQPEYSHVSVKDEKDEHIHGFDTFLDQVSQESRAHAIRYGKMRERQSELGRGWMKHRAFAPKPAKEALVDSISDRIAQQSSDQIKVGVRESINTITKLTGIEHRAWMLLQAAGVPTLPSCCSEARRLTGLPGFLDMERLIEHRPPPDRFGFWKRPAIPQLRLSEFNKDWTPGFEPLRCMRRQCKSVIRGSMFVRDEIGTDPAAICEECYRNHYYGKESYTKSYKHCILAESITPEVSRKICQCLGLLQYDTNGEPLSLFPIERDVMHTGAGGPSYLQCNLLRLGEFVALAKYAGLGSSVGVKPRSKRETTKAQKQAREEEAAEKYKFGGKYEESISEFESEKMPGIPKQRLKGIKTVEYTSLHGKDRGPESGATSVAEEAEADEDIPLFFRRYVQKYPYGNVHMALRVGPLVIENGVSHSKGGALVSLREMPVLHERFHLQTMPGRDLAIGGGNDRPVWQRKRHAAGRKRYKAIMKQVVGVPFSGGNILPRDQELAVVKELLAACEQPFDDPGLPASDQIKLLDSALEPVLARLKNLLGSRVDVYLGSIAERLLDKNVKLAWSATSNNCQTFCSSLLDRGIFEPLVNGNTENLPQEASPLYIMSFVCPDEGYRQRGVRTKFDVPFGLTEEYLLRFHFGRHDDADIIDTYQEYWYDWGAFGGTLYRYQDLFPWDCTEAYGRYPTKCGDCNLAKHVWAFPFDSWSMSSHHLSRDRHMYAPAVTDQDLTAAGQGATPSSWMRNRLTVLSAMSALHRAATAMAQTTKFQKATAWLHKGPSHTMLDPSLARVKLGGIHRAQPCSHYFEAGTYMHYFIAPWAALTREKQIEAYELQRDGRVRLPDLPGSSRKARFGEHARKGEYNFTGFAGQASFMDMDSPTDTRFDHPHVGMDQVGDFYYCDSHISPTSEVSEPHTCGSGCGSATLNAADCASAEAVKTAEAAAAAAIAAAIANESHSSCGGSSSWGGGGGGGSSCGGGGGGGGGCGGSSSF
ncbi:hypothetical protein F66182_1957 [Fusarium sp. NRRL 66182]|nr:hypothetical protein F66182_1957 [Fusarium sp. NRRL 66182]